MIETEFLPRVALESMNETHFEEIEIINQISSLIEAKEVDKILNQLQLLHQHTVEHFAKEEDMMEITYFPPYETHKEEHDIALDVLENIIDDWKQNRNLGNLSHYIDEVLPNWLHDHIQTMDYVTANYLVKWHGM